MNQFEGRTFFPPTATFLSTVHCRIFNHLISNDCTKQANFKIKINETFLFKRKIFLKKSQQSFYGGYTAFDLLATAPEREFQFRNFFVHWSFLKCCCSSALEHIYFPIGPKIYLVTLHKRSHIFRKNAKIATNIFLKKNFFAVLPDKFKDQLESKCAPGPMNTNILKRINEQ